MLCCLTHGLFAQDDTEVEKKSSDPGISASQSAEDVDDESGETKSEEGKPADEKSKVETVEAVHKAIAVYESLTGVFESTRMHEVETDFEVWTDLKIESVVDEGVTVSAGETIMQLDDESLRKAVADAEIAARNALFDLELAKLAAEQAKATFELDKMLAEHNWKAAQEDYDYYLNTLLPQQIDDLDYSEKTAGYYLEYSRDELDQLEKMYTEDELTEESEEIVLKRARRDVESAERSQKRTLTSVQRQREFDVPRAKLQREAAHKRNQLEYHRAAITLPIQQKRVEVALAQAEFNLKNKQKQLAELQSDLEKMTITSPANGIVYYGICNRGKWSGAGGGKRQLEPRKSVAAKTVVMTVVDTSQQMIRANLEEAELGSLSPRIRGKAVIGVSSNWRIPVVLKSISRIPLDDGKFDCQIIPENLPADAQIMPGMTCKMSFLVYDNKHAVVVPKASVFSDDDGVTHYVFKMVDDKPVKTEIIAGQTADGDLEITDGLSAGDKISKAKP